MRIISQTAWILAMTAGLAMASQSMQAAQTEAFVLKPIEGGFLRLETRTGLTSVCTGAADNLVCRSAPDERAALEKEIGRLTEENQLLTTEIDAMKVGQPSARVEFKLPSEAEVDKAMSFVERMVKRFKSMIDDLSKESGSQTPL